MGVLNLTPDSFSDGGLFEKAEAGMARARELIQQGADLLDLGGESTRPGAEQVPTEMQLDRLLPVLEGIRSHYDIPVSIDTRDDHVAEVCLEAGADLINDVSALNHSPGMAETIARHKAGVVLMHMRGTPATMQDCTDYQNIAREVLDHLAERVDTALRAGIGHDRIWVDPGIGFGKSAQGNLEILRRIKEIDRLGKPVAIGVSRKSFIGTILGREVEERAAGTAAISAFLAATGVHRMYRVHDIPENRDALRMVESILDTK
jgi:dihydropteroate synthase